MVQKYFRKPDLQNLLLIFIISNLLYFHTYNNAFHLDDFSTIIDRPLVKNLDTFFDSNSPYAASGIFSNRVFLLYSFALNYRWGGLNVFGYHLVNVIIHIIVSILIYFLVKELLFNSFPDRRTQLQYGRTIPLLAALLFSAHPLQTESVTYISSRSTLVVTLCFLGSILLFVKGMSRLVESATKNKQIISFIFFSGGALFFLLGLGFKETILTLPLIVIIYLLLFRLQNVWRLKKTLMFFSLATVFLLSHMAGYFIYSNEIGDMSKSFEESKFQEKSLHDASMRLKNLKKKKHPVLVFLYFSGNEQGIVTRLHQTLFGRIHNIYNTGKDSYSPNLYFLSELQVIPFHYMKTLLLPFNQSVFPDFPPFTSERLARLIVAILAILLIAVFCLKSNNRLILFSFSWYAITIIPTSSFLPLSDLVSEHRTYLPNIGLFIAVSAGISSMLSSKKKFAPVIFLLLLIVSLSMLTIKRNFTWQSEVSLWEDTVNKAPTHVSSINALGIAYTREGENDIAQSLFQRGLNIDPNNNKLHVNLGRIFKGKDNLEKAEYHFKVAVLIKNDYLSRINLGSVYLEKKLYTESILEFNEALKINPESFLANYYLGNAYNEMSQYQMAAKYFKKSVELNPDYARAYNNLGYSYWSLGKQDLAYEWFTKAMKRNPDLLTPYLNIGNYYLFKGDLAKGEYFINQYKEKLKNENTRE